MNNKKLSIFLKFIFPSITIVVLYCVLIFGFIIPAYYDELLQDKKKSLKDLMAVVLHSMDESYQKESAGLLSREEAQREAIGRVEGIRYGAEGKDYFWINDMNPRMIMHPYRADLNGKDLTNYADNRGVKVFVRFVDLVRDSGEAYVHYTWQWKDNSHRIVPKLSYVKLYSHWGWVVGSGVYLDDIRAEISLMVQNISALALLIMLAVAIILVYIIRHTLYSEQLTARAQHDLFTSRERYRALVEASSSCILFIANGAVQYANAFFLSVSGYDQAEIEGQLCETLFVNTDAFSSIDHGEVTGTVTELTLHCKDGSDKTLLGTLSRFDVNGKPGVICSMRDLSEETAKGQQKHEQLQSELIAELQTGQQSLLQEVASCVRPLISCTGGSSIRKAVSLMTEKQTDAILVMSDKEECIGIITDEDIRTRIVNESKGFDTPAFEIMSAPVRSIQGRSSIFEAIYKMHEAGVDHLVMRDAQNRACGIIRSRDLIDQQIYSATMMVHAISRAETIDQIKSIYSKMSMLTSSLVDVGMSVRTITRSLSAITDEIIRNVWRLTVDKAGAPDAGYAFIVLGSLGRQEQTLVSDQDSALIYQDSSDTELVNRQFLSIAESVSDSLAEIGIPLCKGGVMARNPKLCQPLSVWKSNMTRWIETAQPDDLLDINTMLDFRLVDGDSSLVEQLREHVFQCIAARPAFLAFLAREALLKKVPIDRFGNLVTIKDDENPGALDIKMSLLPLVNTARLYALAHAIPETNTIERLSALKEKKIMTEADFNATREAFEFMLGIIFKSHTADKYESTDERTTFVPITHLTETELVLLKKSLSRIQLFVNRITHDYSGISGV